MDLHALVWRMSGLAGARYLGSRLVEGKLQILCYHAFAFADEHRFRGSLFMSPDVFEQRLGWLKKNRYVVLGLAEALARLAAGRIGSREIVITIDDGFHSVHALAAPLLRAHGMTATVYVTSYYVVHQHPVFRLAIQYMAWRSRHDSIEVSSMVPGVEGELPLHGAGAEAALRRFYEAAERLRDERQRGTIAREFGRRAEVDYEELVASRRLSLMSPQEIAALRKQGFSIQLHTHRHRLPDDAREIAREIGDNRSILGTLTDEALEHLCYPSGIWNAGQWPALTNVGVTSATTCLPGLNSPETPALALRRFLDDQDISADEFAAEMLGIKELYRRVRGVTQ